MVPLAVVMGDSGFYSKYARNIANQHHEESGYYKRVKGEIGRLVLFVIVLVGILLLVPTIGVTRLFGDIFSGVFSDGYACLTSIYLVDVILMVWLFSKVLPDVLVYSSLQRYTPIEPYMERVSVVEKNE